MSARDFYPIELNCGIRHYITMNADKFVERLRAKIEADERLTPAGLAKKAGIDNSTIRKLISGENTSPKVATAEKICAALGTTLESFMSGADNEQQAEIIDLYNQLSDSERRLLLAAARGIASEGRKAN